jgi:pimeloyl-ACP methyl ester carboxylesterase
VPFLVSPDGVRLSYSIRGDGPWLLLHLGAGCDASLWDAAGYVGPLSQQYRCILLDHRGHGPSDRPRGAAAYHIDRYESDVLALLEHLKVERTAFWGYSAGVDTGLKLADNHPNRVWALVGSGGMGHTTREEMEEVVDRRVIEMREHGWEPMLDRFDANERQEVPGWMKDRIRATDAQQFTDYLQAALTWEWDDWDALPRIGTPTLFVAGGLEDPDDETAVAVSRMQNANRIRLDGLGHMNAFLGSELVLPHVLPFLARYAPGREGPG